VKMRGRINEGFKGGEVAPSARVWPFEASGSVFKYVLFLFIGLIDTLSFSQSS